MLITKCSYGEWYTLYASGFDFNPPTQKGLIHFIALSIWYKRYTQYTYDKKLFINWFNWSYKDSSPYFNDWSQNINFQWTNEI